MSIKISIDNFCAKFKNNTAFIVKENKNQVKISYEKFHSDIVSLANGIYEKGISNACIAVSGKNSYTWMVSALAVFYSGNILVPIDGGLSPEEFTRVCTRSKAVLLIYSKEISEKATVQEIPSIICMDDIDSLKSANINDMPEINPDETGVLMFTSGTTSLRAWINTRP